MDAGASHPSGFFRKLNRKRRVMNYEQRNFCKNSLRSASSKLSEAFWM